MRSDLCGGLGTKRSLGPIATDNDGQVIDMTELRRSWNTGVDIIQICLDFNVTIPLLYRIVRKFGKFDHRSFSGGDGSNSRMDLIPEDELIELVKTRSAAIRKTWTPDIERARRARHSKFLEN